MADKKYNFLTTGLNPKWLSAAKARGVDTLEVHTQEEVFASLDKFKAQMAELKNVTFDTLTLNPDEADTLDKWRAKLKEKQWDGVSFGGGVRQIPHVEALFENLINIAKDETKAECRFVFPLLPEYVIPAFKRQIPDVS